MKAMKIAFYNQLESLVLIAGDGDFKDMVEFFTEQLYRKVWIFGYKSSLSASLHEKATPGCVFFLDDIWEMISIPIVNTQEKSAELKKSVINQDKIIFSPEITDAQSKNCGCEEAFESMDLNEAKLG
jgi:hypothetical protein